MNVSADSLSSWGYNMEAEESVLGAVLMDNAVMDVVIDVVKEQDFFASRHQAVWRVCVGLITAGKMADVITVSDALKALDANEYRDCLSMLGAMVQGTASTFNARRYAEMVADRAMRRRLFSAASQVQESVMRSPRVESGELKAKAEQAILSACADASDRGGFVFVQAMLTGVMDEIDRRFHSSNPDDLIGLATGFTDLDRQTLGMQPGQLIIVGARPGMGKSAFALNLAENSARISGRHALFFSLEMSIRQLAFRMLAQSSTTNVQRLYTGRLNDNDWGRVSDAVGRLHDLPVAFCERGDVRMADIRSLSRRAKRQFGGLSVIVVDYLQLMLGSDSESNRAAQLSEITRGLKLMAKELEVPVIALSQLNRDLEKRTNRRPIVADLRDSGSIEQDADNIYFLYRDEVYNPRSEDKGIAEVIIAKQRDGPTGTIRLSFRADHTRFGNYVGAAYEAAA